MSLSVALLLHVPERTTAVAHAAFPRGSRHMMIRDELGTIYRGDRFAHLYPNVANCHLVEPDSSGAPRCDIPGA
jgi:transposase